MSKYTSRTEVSENEIIAWIDRDGLQMIRQPHHPSALNNETWPSENEAKAWADEAIKEIVANEKKQAEQITEQEALIAQAKADSALLAEMAQAIKEIQTILK
jgi:hypothetical protein